MQALTCSLVYSSRRACCRLRVRMTRSFGGQGARDAAKRCGVAMAGRYDRYTNERGPTQVRRGEGGETARGAGQACSALHINDA